MKEIITLTPNELLKTPLQDVSHVLTDEKSKRLSLNEDNNNNKGQKNNEIFEEKNVLGVIPPNNQSDIYDFLDI